MLSALAQPSDRPEDANVAPPAEVGMTLKRVTYHGVDEHTGDLKPLLKNVSLNLPPGGKVALVGVSRPPPPPPQFPGRCASAPSPARQHVSPVAPSDRISRVAKDIPR